MWQEQAVVIKREQAVRFFRSLPSVQNTGPISLDSDDEQASSPVFQLPLETLPDDVPRSMTWISGS